MRTKLLLWLKYNLTNRSDAEIPPKWLRVLYYILFPLRWYINNNTDMSFDYSRLIYTIRGIKITSEVFENFEQLAEKETTLKFSKKGDCITITRI